MDKNSPKEILKVVQKNLSCTGCFACYNVCNSDAIEMVFNEDGFYVPQIDLNECTYCYKCVNTCPAINEVSNTNNAKPKTLLTWSLDEFVLNNSTSGGMFYEFSKKFIEEGGIVLTAVWKNSSFKHISIENINQLNEIVTNKLQKSKYLQSNVGLAYEDALKNLKNNKRVLLFGLPCQIAAMKKISDDRFKDLLLVDIVCHGVPSVKLFKEYIKYKYDLEFKGISNVDFRNKRNGWKGSFHLGIQKKDKRIINRHYMQDGFYKGFMHNIFLNNPCYDCKFSSLPRYGDISIGDFWGAPLELVKKNKNRGISVVLLNNIKGERFMNKIIDSGRIFFKEKSLQDAKKVNRIFSGKHPEVQKTRMIEFFGKYKATEVDKLEKAYFAPESLIKILFRKILKFMRV
jgi:coenzyme F420-reducing hydrogenase beta subunit